MTADIVQTPDPPEKTGHFPEDFKNNIPESIRTIAPRTALVRKSSPFYGRKRADEVAAVYLDQKTRWILGKALALKGSDLWDVILSFIDAGTLTPTTLSMQGSPDLRLLLPATPQAYARRFDLGTRTAIAENLRKVVATRARQGQRAWRIKKPKPLRAANAKRLLTTANN